MTKTKTSYNVEATNLVDRLPDNTEYFFLDFIEKQPNPRWVRMPFLTWNQVMRVLNDRNAYDAHLRQQSKKGHLRTLKGVSGYILAFSARQTLMLSRMVAPYVKCCSAPFIKEPPTGYEVVS